MYITDYLGIPKGHAKIAFVDCSLDSDNRFFIDPMLIELSSDPWCMKSTCTIKIFFDLLYDMFKSPACYSGDLLSHAGEQNATKLGYGNGFNGKGKTELGLWESLRGLQSLLKDIPTICVPQDIPVFVKNFAEDCMSDLLTNILHEPLNTFTREQMGHWGIPPQGEKNIWTFNADIGGWSSVTRPCWYYKGKELLLVPKWIVRKNFLFCTHQYLYSVIAERIRRESGRNDWKKIDIINNLPHKSSHWEYDNAISYTREYPEALSEYHRRMPKFYRRANATLGDDDLDREIYGYSITQTA